ncbi:MAG: hypothetical protein C4525_13270 [Desulfarculus sp.]|nr:MAG: hypothetical protein C4525_13270 [Desulfarculus sp.]
MSDTRPDFSFIIRDNEAAVARALAAGEFIQAYLLVHALMESLLRVFLRVNEETTFHALIERYKEFLLEEGQTKPTFAKELTEFNRRRNRIVHQLWRKGFSFTNKQVEPAARAAVMVYGLFIEWLETFDPEIKEAGFKYHDGD